MLDEIKPPAFDPAAMEAAIGAQLAKTLPGMLGSHLERALAPHLAKLAAPKAEPEKPADAIKDSAAEQRIAALEAERKRDRAELAAERKRSRDKEAHASLRSALAGKVRAEAVDDVADLLRARGHLVVAEDGTATMRFGADEHETIEAGVAAYLKSKGAAHFLPAPGATKALATKSGPAPLPALAPGHKLTAAERMARTLAQLGQD